MFTACHPCLCSQKNFHGHQFHCPCWTTVGYEYSQKNLHGEKLKPHAKTMKLYNHETKVLYSTISEQMITIYVYYARHGQFSPTQAVTSTYVL